MNAMETIGSRMADMNITKTELVALIALVLLDPSKQHSTFQPFDYMHFWHLFVIVYFENAMYNHAGMLEIHIIACI